MQVFTSVLVFIVFFTVYVVTDLKTYKARKEKNMVSLAKVLATNSSSAIDFDDAETARSILLDLKNGAPDVVHAVTTNGTGNIFASYARDGSLEFTMPPQLQTKTSFFTKDNLFVSQNILLDQTVVGRVMLEIDLSELEGIKKSKFRLAIILLLVAVAFSVIVAYVIQFYISRRLLRLSSTMDQVSRTVDYNKTLTDDGKDEIGTLIRVFNNLMNEIKLHQQRKDEFIGVASHELKTPLTTIKGYLDLLNNIEDKQPNKQFVQKSLSNVNKLESLIKDLLDVSNIQSGHLKLSKQEFNIDVLIDESIAAMQMVSETHDIVREGTLSGALVTADRLRIEQVLTNLLSNAMKYSPGENKVILSSLLENGEVIVRIRDYGMGVPDSERTQIFERFYRTKDMKITITGFGLGLYICRDIIRRHGGKIWIEAEDKGSSFYFSLPLHSN